MTDFFPPDIKLRVDGDHDVAQELYGPARNLLYKAQLKQSADPDTPVSLHREIEGVGTIDVLLRGILKIVRVVAKKIVAVLPGGKRFFGPLTGMIKTTKIVLNGDTPPALEMRFFRPTLECATATGTTNAWAGNKQLAVYDNQVPSGVYSGTMCNVVQMVQSLGIISDDSGYYLTKPVATKRGVQNTYTYSWLKTQGVYKAGAKNYWLVEISKDRGILAMPLCMIPSTMTAEYKAKIRVQQYTAVMEILNEFGGLPSGENFPNGADLEAAITAKKVLRLKTAADMDPFYAIADGSAVTPTYDDCGWAFSGSGRQARNVRITREPGVHEISNEAGVLTNYDVLRGEHWEITLSLTTHRLSFPVGDPDGVGSGTATLTRLSRGIVDQVLAMFFVPDQVSKRISIFTRHLLNRDPPYTENYAKLSNASGRLFTAIHPTFVNERIIWPSNTASLYSGASNAQSEHTGFVFAGDVYAQEEWGCVMHTFFDGEKPKVVRWHPEHYYDYDQQNNFVATYQLDGHGPNEDSFGLYSVSPNAFTVDGIDIREISYGSWRETSAVYWDPYLPNTDHDPIDLGVYTNYSSPSTTDLDVGNYWATVPLGCREGIVLSRQKTRYVTSTISTPTVMPGGPFLGHHYEQVGVTSTSGPTYSDYHVGYFSGVGRLNLTGKKDRQFLHSDDAWSSLLIPTNIYYPPFGWCLYNYTALVNHGKTKSYMITKYVSDDLIPYATQEYARLTVLAASGDALPNTSTYVGNY